MKLFTKSKQELKSNAYDDTVDALLKAAADLNKAADRVIEASEKATKVLAELNKSIDKSRVTGAAKIRTW